MGCLNLPKQDIAPIRPARPCCPDGVWPRAMAEIAVGVEHRANRPSPGALAPVAGYQGERRGSPGSGCRQFVCRGTQRLRGQRCARMASTTKEVVRARTSQFQGPWTLMTRRRQSPTRLVSIRAALKFACWLQRSHCAIWIMQQPSSRWTDSQAGEARSLRGPGAVVFRQS